MMKIDKGIKVLDDATLESVCNSGGDAYVTPSGKVIAEFDGGPCFAASLPDSSAPEGQLRGLAKAAEKGKITIQSSC